MEVIKSFDFNSKSLTVYGTADKPMFKAKEVAEFLDINDIHTSLRDIDMSFLHRHSMPTSAGERKITFEILDKHTRREIAAMLGYINASDALIKHVDNEDKQIIANRDNIKQVYINEPGIYSLAILSKLPDAFEVYLFYL